MEVGEGSRIGGRWSSLIRLKIFVVSILQCFMSMFQQSLFDLTYMTPSRASEGVVCIRCLTLPDTCLICLYVVVLL